MLHSVFLSARQLVLDALLFCLRALHGLYGRFGKKPVGQLRKCINWIQIHLFHKGKLQDRVLVKYLVKELLLYFSVAFLFFFMIFFVNQILLLAENILKKRVPFPDVVRLITYCLPFVIAQSAPFATLVGFLMCLGRLMSDNEVLILRASGQSYVIIMLPVIVLGLLISIFSFFVNDYLLPIGNINYNKLYRQILASNPGVEIEANTIKRLNNATIIIGDVKDNVVSDLVFFDKGRKGTQRIIVAGKSSLVSAKKEGVLMQMNMTDSAVVFLDTSKRMNFDILDSDATVLNIFDSSFFSGNYSTTPREMTSYDLGRLIKSMKGRKNYSKRQLNLYRMEYNKKFSLPFGSIFFAVLALPLAFLFGKHNGQTIGLIIGLFICVLYWAMMILGQIFSSRNGISGFWAMWFPDIVIGIAGLLFYVVLKKK
ncbi:MAG: LptF/LptG family permease [Treponemataceae bacterium]|nr:LptF/LptG family permease [Treponemataceae bacterium]